jgi:hypothetical protein
MTPKDKEIIAEMFAMLLQHQCVILNILNGKRDSADRTIEYMLTEYGKNYDKILDKIIEWRDND